MDKLLRSAWGQLVFIPTMLTLVALLFFFSTLIGQVRQEQGPTPDNRATWGRVTRLGASAIRFGYNVPGEPRKPWSFERDQAGNAADLKGFAVGQKVKIEYSDSYPGIARVQGFAITPSVQGDFQVGITMNWLRLSPPLLIFGIVVRWATTFGGIQWMIKQWQARRE